MNCSFLSNNTDQFIRKVSICKLYCEMETKSILLLGFEDLYHLVRSYANRNHNFASGHQCKCSYSNPPSCSCNAQCFDMLGSSFCQTASGHHRTPAFT